MIQAEMAFRITSQSSTAQPVNSNGWHLTMEPEELVPTVRQPLLSMVQATFMSPDAVNEQLSFIAITIMRRSNTTRMGKNNGWPGTTGLGIAMTDPTLWPLITWVTSM